MGMLIRIELHKVFRSRLAWLSLTLAVALGVAAAVINVIDYERMLPLTLEYAGSKYSYPYAYSVYCDWLPVDGLTSLPYLYFLVAPLLIALAYSWSLRGELRSGWAQQMLMRTSRTRYYVAKWVAAFCAGALVTGASLVANLVVLACFLPAYQPDVNDVLYIGLNYRALLSEMFYSVPFAYVLARLALDCVLAGLWAGAVLGLSILVRNRVAVVALPYVALVVLKYATQKVYGVFATGGWRQSVTLFDLLRAHGDKYDYGWGAVAVACALMLVLAIVPPLIARKRDVL